ncbi:MAG: ABC transporter permease [Huintestinicola sp.]
MKKRFFSSFAAVVFWLAVWQAAAMAVNREIILVTPVQALTRLIELIPETGFRKTILLSLGRYACGFIAGSSAGILLAVLSFRWKGASVLFSPLMSAVKSVPVASFVILALFWMNSRYLPVFISFMMAMPIVYHSVLKGLASADEKLLEAAAVFGMTGSAKARYIYLPAVMPFLTSACETAVGVCFKSGAAAEVIAQPANSLGDMLYRAKIYLETADLFAWTLVIILLSKLCESVVIYALKGIFRLTQRVKMEK